MVNKINDYILELGWDGKKAVAGIDAIEKRLNKLAAAADKLSGAGGGVSKPQGQPSSAPVNRERELVKLENQRLTILNAIEGKERKLQILRDTVSTRTKRGKLLAAEIDESIRKVERFRREIQETSLKGGRDLLELRNRQRQFNTSVGEGVRNIKRMSREMGVLEAIGRRAGASFKSFAAASLGAYAIVNLGRAAYRSAKEMESLEVSLQAAFGSQAESAKQMEYVKDVSTKFALDINAAGDGWAKIALSAKASNMPMKDAQTIFENTAMASRAFNLSADDTKGTMRALVQMMGKGKVNAEDMRQQLAERIPAAMPILAKSMGVSYQAMEKMMAEGKIGADALVGWSQEMADMVNRSGAYKKGMETMSAGQALMTNAMKLSNAQMFKGRLDKALGGGMSVIGDYLDGARGFMGSTAAIFASFVDVVSWVAGVVEPVFSMILQGWSEIYEVIAAVTQTDTGAFKRLNGLGKLIRIFSGLFYEAKYGWDLLSKAFANASWEASLRHLRMVIGSIGRLWSKMTGQTYTDEMGEEQEGWGFWADKKKSKPSYAAWQERKQSPQGSQISSTQTNNNGNEFSFNFNGYSGNAEEFAQDVIPLMQTALPPTGG